MIQIGDFVIIAGYQSLFLTHSVNIYNNRQESLPIFIRSYTFVGTNSTIFGGVSLPKFSFLGAKSLLNKEYSERYKLYSVVPARQISDFTINAEYFNREVRNVV
jgi:acetyltransferase-like isoleucine patch superfamily enzyme